ncbi:alpha/beta fold hydrolase [Bacterioplanoides sp. SCSIO 12839]|uniref:alpha/beta fold hydrolase n=1 Tax=Bacterioplanoides sp. SCSIO 12839 TaxID=2829569 RepID=UPI0021046F5B|nr:alpha/beta hydrolase [Bacterioplanoides sp. SCSIO 12839]UTW49413.1 alpha/beta hydrolase [Bacterioplanoides sp. SCSIO 12839]
MKITRLLMVLGTMVLSMAQLTGCASMGMGSRPLSELTQNYANQESQFLAVDDLVIHYRDEGLKNGPVLVLLHGVASSLHTWDGWVEQLSDRYRIIRIDLPAHGLTGPDPKLERYEINYMVDKLDKFLTKLNINQIYLAGNSLGGYISWNYALHRPDRVQKLVLIDSAGYPQEMPFIMNFTALPVIGEMSTLMLPRFMVGLNVDAAYGDDSKVTDELVKRYHDLTLRPGNRKGLVNVFRTMKEQSQNPHLADRVKDIQAPTMLMWGEEDEWVPLEVMEQFRNDLPTAHVITYEGVGHMPMEELPVQSARDAADFLQQ